MLEGCSLSILSYIFLAHSIEIQMCAVLHFGDALDTDSVSPTIYGSIQRLLNSINDNMSIDDTCTEMYLNIPNNFDTLLIYKILLQN